MISDTEELIVFFISRTSWSPPSNCSLACVIVNLSPESALQRMNFSKNYTCDCSLNLLSIYLNDVQSTTHV